MGSKNAMFQSEPADELMLNQNLMGECSIATWQRLNAFGEYLENLYDGADWPTLLLGYLLTVLFDFPRCSLL